MLNGIFASLIILAVGVGALSGRMKDVTEGAISGASSSVELAIGLAGQMALWLGFLGILERAGLTRRLAVWTAPVARRLFPDIPPDHPALSAIVLNVSANLLGLGNAATPFGLRAMRELARIAPRPGVASNAMVTFLAINTSGVTLIPLFAIAGRAEFGADDVAGIIWPTALATTVSTLVGVTVAKLLEGRARFAPERYPEHAPFDGESEPEAEPSEVPEPSRAGLGLSALVLGGLAVAAGMELARSGAEALPRLSSDWPLPVLMAGIVLVGLSRRVAVYDAFIAAARDGFRIAVGLIPYLVAILVAIGMLRASGALELALTAVRPLSDRIGLPAEVLPMAFLRPLSGSGAYAVMMDTMRTHGPDSFSGFLVSVMNGSTETTFYVLAVYLGAARVYSARHAVIACLSADFAGILAALAASRLFYGLQGG